MTSYADLEIGLHRRDVTNRYTIELRFTDPQSEGEATQRGHVRFDMEQLQRCLLKPADYGRVLRDNLFADPVIRDKFSHARAVAGSNPLRLRLNIGDSAPELHTLRWETLRDLDDMLLSTDEYTHFSRYLSSDNWRSVQLRSKSALRALVVIANPIDLDSYEPVVYDFPPLMWRRSANGPWQGWETWKPPS